MESGDEFVGFDVSAGEMDDISFDEFVGFEVPCDVSVGEMDDISFDGGGSIVLEGGGGISRGGGGGSPFDDGQTNFFGGGMEDVVLNLEPSTSAPGLINSDLCSEFWWGSSGSFEATGTS